MKTSYFGRVNKKVNSGKLELTFYICLDFNDIIPPVWS